MQLTHYLANQARELTPSFLGLYTDVYGVPPYVGDPFFSVETYAGRLSGAMDTAGFEIVTATEYGVLIGTGHGVTLPPTAAWWQTLLPSLPEEFLEAAEEGSIFWLRELMVREPYRNKGVGRALHDELSGGRAEDLVAMTVIVDNEPARSAYLRWGYEIIGQIRHAPESPLYDAMVRANKR